MKKYSGLRATLGAVVVGLVCTSCSALSAFSTGTKPTVQPAPTEAAAPAASASAAPVTVNARHRKQVRQRFLAGVNGYCRAWYVMQKAANNRYPTTAGDHARSLLLRAGTERVLGRLHDLRAPSASSRAQVHSFLGNERQLIHDFTEETSRNVGIVQAGGTDYTQTLANRHDLATTLGAKECDGLLPHGQRLAAVAATRRWDVTASAHENCVTLVAPEFSVSTWGETPDPLAKCEQEFYSRRASPLGPQRAIQVQSVTGVEDLQATVTFHQVPDCGCGALVAKLYFEGGRWLLNEVYSDGPFT